VLYDVSDGVATITLNRPDALNAVNDALDRDLKAALKAAERDPEARALVLTGAGRAFCSGQDLRDRAGITTSLGESLRNRYNVLIGRMRGMPKPVLASVNGVAAGAGMGLALGCDMILASDRAQFLMAFMRIGLIPDSGSTYFLPRLVGYPKAFELMALPEPLSAHDAHALGIVNRVCPHEELEGATREVATRLAQSPTTAVGLLKRALNHSLEGGLEDALAYEAHMQELAGRTEDFQEGVAAFAEKRQPRFKGR
jgi:2-(1,2-epoxy-1,2-dihydrophenyl)acetyl-CoA isomerase